MGEGLRRSQRVHDQGVGRLPCKADHLCRVVGRLRGVEGRPPERRPSGCLPAAPLHGWTEARWVLANFGGLFRLLRGPIFNPKEAGNQVQYIMNQMKEIWGKTGLRFDRSEFSKFDS